MITLRQTRRQFLIAGSGLALISALPFRALLADDTIVISMAGGPNGAKVWFQPRGLFIKPGQTVKWVNNDEGNVHTATAYHADYNKPLRIPAKATPWDSGYLMPGESFSITFTESGVYDYFCIPHEQAGMTGRIVVGKVDGDARPYEESNTLLPKNAVANLPTVADIIRHDTIN
ncbi:MAG TPA: plastocyanin/azurin family copper-binding protein [Burkholderiaceae bacterium]|nr:plastocyanin/azurin family copper-binding protein [Burkholderiaceae bacterium]